MTSTIDISGSYSSELTLVQFKRELPEAEHTPFKKARSPPHARMTEVKQEAHRLLVTARCKYREHTPLIRATGSARRESLMPEGELRVSSRIPASLPLRPYELVLSDKRDMLFFLHCGLDPRTRTSTQMLLCQDTRSRTPNSSSCTIVIDVWRVLVLMGA